MSPNNLRNWIILCAAGLTYLASPVAAEPLLGRAVIASLRGDAHYEWEDGSEVLEEGMALAQGYRVVTAREASLCAVLTPGALLCVHEDTDLGLETLEHATSGLPGADKVVKRRISLKLSRGAILVQAGEPAVDRSIAVDLGGNTLVQATGGRFIIASERGVRYVLVEAGTVTVKQGESGQILEAGSLMTLTPPAAGDGDAWKTSVDSQGVGKLKYEFHVCRSLFRPLGPMTFDWDWENLSGLNDWIEPSAGITYIGVPLDWQDVSPSIRQTGSSRYQASAVPAGGSGGGKQWRRPDIWDWYARIGAVRGVVYVPRTAVNATEMWQAETFDADLIDEELGWAENSGHDSLRVFLPYLVWENDRKGLKDRMGEFLSLADKHGMSTVFVLFDDYNPSGKQPYPGKQADPLPGVHNSQWTPNPGPDKIRKDQGAWPDLERYVKDVVGHFEGDERVLMWDVYNDPGHSDMGLESLPLLEAAFAWVREIAPEQPLTAGLGPYLDQTSLRRVMRLCDVITFTAYESVEDLEAKLLLTEVRGRPVFCTGWLSRTRGNTFGTVLPVLARHGVGWYHWGLVTGRTQTYMPWQSAQGAAKPEVWEQDLLNEQGEPLDKEEIELIRGFSFDVP